MEIKTTSEIWNENLIEEETDDQWGRKGRGIPLKYMKQDEKNKKWVAVDELLNRIEIICNHGNERDMRFKNQLIKELKDSPNKQKDETWGQFK